MSLSRKKTSSDSDVTSSSSSSDSDSDLTSSSSSSSSATSSSSSSSSSTSSSSSSSSSTSSDSDLSDFSDDEKMEDVVYLAAGADTFEKYARQLERPGVRIVSTSVTLFGAQSPIAKPPAPALDDQNADKDIPCAPTPSSPSRP